MKIKLRSTYAVARTDRSQGKPAPEGYITFDLSGGDGTVYGLLISLPGLGPPEAFDDIMIHVFVNGALVGFDHRLSPGDKVDIHIPVSGG
ncbi:MAG: MoaD/ThiS family protein [Desulfobacteraceae bacterium]